MKTIAEEWAAFEKQVLPPGAGAAQRHDMRVAFYCGAGVILQICRDTIGDPNTPDEQGVAMLEALMHETFSFVQGAAASAPRSGN